MQDEIHNFPEQNSSNKPIAELTDCYQPSLCEGEIMKKKKKGRERKEGGGREEKGERERRGREELQEKQKVLSVTLGTYSCNHGVGMCFDSNTHTHTHISAR